MRQGWLGALLLAAVVAGTACGGDGGGGKPNGSGGDGGSAGTGGTGGTAGEGGSGGTGGSGGSAGEGGSGGTGGSAGEGGTGGNTCEGEGEACTPENACLQGTIDCSTGTAICVAGEPVPDGTTCDDGACREGVCSPLLTVRGVDTTGLAGRVNTELQVTVELVDWDLASAIPGHLIRGIAPEGGSVSPSMAISDDSGRATFTLFLPRSTGTASFAFESEDAAAATVDVEATAAPEGVVRTLVNFSHGPGSAEDGVPGPLTSLLHPNGLVAGSDGTLFVTDGSCRVFRLSPAGELTVVAGSICGPSTGSGGDAKAAELEFPRGLALDETNGLLYVGETHRVRQVELATGTIRDFAGNGLTRPAPYGDGGAATDAWFQQVGEIALGPDGTLYVVDIGLGSIRAVNTSGIVSTWLAPRGTTAGCSDDVEFVTCAFSEGCSLAFDAAGQAVVAARFCGTDPAIRVEYAVGIARRGEDGSFDWVAGNGEYRNPQFGGPATEINFGSPRMAFDEAGQLFVSDTSLQRVVRIDTAGRLFPAVGTGGNGAAADGLPGPQTPLTSPKGVAVAGGDLFFVEMGAHSIKSIAGEGSSEAPQLVLAQRWVSTAGGYLPAGNIMELAADVAVGGAYTDGVPVRWRSLDPGGVVQPVSLGSDAHGLARATGRVGIVPGSWWFEGSLRDIHGNHAAGSPALFEVVVSTPAPGTVHSVLNLLERTGVSGFPGPSTAGVVSGPAGIAAASDGTVYFVSESDYRLFRISPTGELTHLAGQPWGSSAPLGDGGPAIDAQFFSPQGLALDEARSKLYVSDRGNRLVRVIDLDTGLISTAAGVGANAPTGGDGGPATSASLGYSHWVAVAPDGALYVSDESAGAIRRVDPVTGVIDAVLTNAGVCTGGVAWIGSDSNSNYAPIAVGPDGKLYAAGRICDASGTATLGIVRLEPGGTLTHIAGNHLSGPLGGAATGYRFADLRNLAVDAGGNVWVSSGNRMMKVDAASGVISVVAGGGTGGDWTVGGAARLTQSAGPMALAAGPGGRVFFTDPEGSRVRVIW